MDTEKKTALQMLDEARDRKCHDVILGITQMALDNHEIIHIHTRYSPHVNGFSVSVNPATETYEVPARQKGLENIYIYLGENRYPDDATPLQQLLELEDKLLELIAEAKDKAEVAA